MPQRIVVNSIVNAGPPVTEPTSLLDMKTHLRVTHSMDDQLITFLLTAARGLMEELCHTAIVLQTQTLTLDQFPGNDLGWWEGEREGALVSFQTRELWVPRPPLVSIQSINTYDLANNETAYDLTQGVVNTSDPKMPGRFSLNIGSIWPVDLRRADAVAVASTNGWAITATDVSTYHAQPIPYEIVLAHRMLVTQLYNNRGDNSENAVEKSGAMGYLLPFIQREPAMARFGENRRPRRW